MNQSIEQQFICLQYNILSFSLYFRMQVKEPITKQNFQLYGVIFDGKMPTFLRQELQQQKISSVLMEQTTWRITQFDFVKDNWKNIFLYIRQASFRKLVIIDNSYKRLLIDISKPKFIRLKQIFLTKNHISSIEQLQFTSMPFLAELHLDSNLITKTKALNKCAWNSLKTLSLINNPVEIIEFERLLLTVNTKNAIKNVQSRVLWIKWVDVNRNTLMKINFNRIWWSGDMDIDIPRRLQQCIKRKNQS